MEKKLKKCHHLDKVNVPIAKQTRILNTTMMMMMSENLRVLFFKTSFGMRVHLKRKGKYCQIPKLSLYGDDITCELKEKEAERNVSRLSPAVGSKYYFSTSSFSFLFFFLIKTSLKVRNLQFYVSLLCDQW